MTGADSIADLERLFTGWLGEISVSIVNLPYRGSEKPERGARFLGIGDAFGVLKT